MFRSRGSCKVSPEQSIMGEGGFVKESANVLQAEPLNKNVGEQPTPVAPSLTTEPPAFSAPATLGIKSLIPTYCCDLDQIVKSCMLI